MTETKIEPETKAIERFDERHQSLPAIPQPLSQQASFFEAIERLAANPAVDVEKMKQIMEMQEHVLDRNAEQAFNAAMTQAQNKIGLVVASSKNQQTGSKYADLKTILLAVKPIYTDEGFSLMFYEGETQKENHIRVCVDIMHKQGCTKKRHADMAVQTTGIAGKAMMTQIHGEGSAFSYGRRYLTCLVFNVPTGDDDGNAAGGVQYINDKQLSSIVDMINSKGVNKALFLKHMGAKSTATIQSKDFNRAIDVLKRAKGTK